MRRAARLLKAPLSSELDALARSALELKWHLDPVDATAAGVTAHDGRYGRFSAEEIRPHLAALRSMSGALEQIDVAALEEEIDRTALLDDLRMTLVRYEREQPQATNPEFYLTHLLGGLHYLLVRQDYTPDARVGALASRLADVPALLDDAREALVRPVPLFAGTAARVLDGGRALVAELAALYPVLAPAAQDARIALDAFDTDLDQWREAGEGTFAIGEDAFNFRLHHQHALRATAPELWRYGLTLVEEVETELAQQAEALGGRSWQQVADRLRQDHPATTDLVGAYAREMARARDFVEQHDLAALPDEPLEVVRTPSFMRPLIPRAAYQPPGPYARDRVGWFYVTVPDQEPGAHDRLLRDHCIHEIAATALHEGYPGHHLQVLRGQASRSEVRRNLLSPVTVEGWALYCEEMMGEEGFYQTKEQRFFQRVHLLFRAVRILLDVGLHTRGTTFGEAVDMLVQRIHLEPEHADAEVRRYCGEAAYALSYAVGRRELLALRAAYVDGGRSLRDFHEAVLAYGGLPVWLIRWGLGFEEA